jgi:hypothetical protein
MLGRLCTPQVVGEPPATGGAAWAVRVAAAARASIPLHAVHAVGSSGILQVRVDRSAHAMVDCKLLRRWSDQGCGTKPRCYACATGALSGAGVMSVGHCRKTLHMDSQIWTL